MEFFDFDSYIFIIIAQSQAQSPPRASTAAVPEVDNQTGFGIQTTGVPRVQQRSAGIDFQGDGRSNGLKWNSASSLSRIAAQKRFGSSAGVVQQQQHGGGQQWNTTNTQHPYIHNNTATTNNTHGRFQVPSRFDGSVTSNTTQKQHPPHQAQLSEMQRQLDAYKQQLLFKQQEIDELRRQSTRIVMNNDVSEKNAMHSDAGLVRGGKRKSGLSGASPSSGVQEHNPNNSNNEREYNDVVPGRGLEHPSTPTLEKSASFGETHVPCIVPHVWTREARVHVSLYDRLERVQRHVDRIRKYKSVRMNLHGVNDGEFSGAVLGTLETVMGSQKPNWNDVSLVLLSTIMHVLYHDAKNMSEKYTVEYVEDFIDFSTALFGILNEFAMDGMCEKMLDISQEKDESKDPLWGMMQPDGKSISQSIIYTMGVAIMRDSGSSIVLLEGMLHFVLAMAEQRTGSSRLFFAPLLKSKEMRHVLLNYHSLRSMMIRFIMICMEERDVVVDMELSAALEMKVSPSKHLTANQYRTPSRLRPRTHRRNSAIQKRLDNADADYCDPSWAPRLVQSVCLCLSVDSSPDDEAWNSVRHCLAFFANLLERHAEALVSSVIEYSRFEGFDESRLRNTGGPEHMIVKTLPLQLIDIANKASGFLNSSTAQIMPIYPEKEFGSDTIKRKGYLRRLRIVQESLTLLRGCVAHPRFGSTTVSSLARDSHLVLCVLEKMTRYQSKKEDHKTSKSEPILLGYPLALWVQGIGTSSSRASLCPTNLVSSRGFDSYPSIEDITYLSRAIKSIVLNKLDADKAMLS